MTIQEILEAHDADWHQDDWWVVCKCGFEAPIIGGTGSEDARDSYRAHVAEVLDKHMQEARAQELEDYASAIEYIDDAIFRDAERDDRWYDFTEAETQFNQLGYEQPQSYVTATTQYAKYRADQIRKDTTNGS